MSRRLKMAMIDSIRTLKRQGHSNRAIARMLGVHRETVNKYVLRLLQHDEREDSGGRDNDPSSNSDPSKPANAHTGSAAEGESASSASSAPPAPHNFENSLPNHSADSSLRHRPPGRTSQCERFRQQIEEKLQQGLDAQRIFQDLKSQYDFPGAYPSVQRFVRKLKQQSPLPFRRLECEPGEEMQVDFGSGIPLDPAADRSLHGKASRARSPRRRRTWVFRIVLSYSRKGYSEVVLRQTTDAFLRCLENAFWRLGGVPARIVLDNLRAAVKNADWYEPELHPKIRSFAAHYGTVFVPTKPYTPRHKGKVERGVAYVKNNGLKGHRFTRLEQQNEHLWQWEQTVADTRIHGTTRKQVLAMFEQQEKPALLPLPAARFPLFVEKRRKVNRDGHVEVDKAYYSAPPEYLGQSVWARWDSRLVALWWEDRQGQLQRIALHSKQPPGKFSTQPGHIPGAKISPVERGAAYYLERASAIGRQTAAWSQTMLQRRGVQGVRVLLGLLNLAREHHPQAVEQACESAHRAGCYRLKTVRRLVGKNAPLQGQFSFMQDHQVIRPLAEYDQLVRTAFGEQVSAPSDAAPSLAERTESEGTPTEEKTEARSLAGGECSAMPFPPLTLPFSPPF